MISFQLVCRTCPNRLGHKGYDGDPELQKGRLGAGGAGGRESSSGRVLSCSSHMRAVTHLVLIQTSHARWFPALSLCALKRYGDDLLNGRIALVALLCRALERQRVTGLALRLVSARWLHAETRPVSSPSAFSTMCSIAGRRSSVHGPAPPVLDVIAGTRRAVGSLHTPGTRREA